LSFQAALLPRASAMLASSSTGAVFRILECGA
jgi:hypothetical protein